MTGGVTGFNHVGISVADIDRSIAFYRDVFGMEQACEVFPFGGEQYLQIMALPDPQGRMCMMAKGNLMLELFEFSNPEPPSQDPGRPVSDRGLTHFGVWVEDIEGTFERMKAAGVRFHCPVLRFPGGMKASYGRDPDGNVFELLEREG
jgi:catechol 2,3-dioxygenase-like lactoylglutathione lyase family enzyme